MSKIDCGTLTPIRKGDIEFQGRIQLGNRLDGVLTLRKHPRAGSSDDHPDFAVEYAPNHGRPRPAGAAWIKSGAQIGDFLSITLDDPDWPTALNLSAFPPSAGSAGKDLVLVWSRPRGMRVQDHASDDLSSGSPAPKS